MRFLLRATVLAVLAGIVFSLFLVARASQAGDNPDGGQLVACYAGIVLAGAGLAAFGALWCLPAIGDFVGSMLYSPEATERHPHASALAKIAAGDYPAAVEAYCIRLQEVPEDILAVHEVVHIYCDKLHDPASAAAFLDEMLEYGDWNDYQRGLLTKKVEEIRATVPEAGHSGHGHGEEPGHEAGEFADSGL